MNRAHGGATSSCGRAREVASVVTLRALPSGFVRARYKPVGAAVGVLPVGERCSTDGVVTKEVGDKRWANLGTRYLPQGGLW